VREYQALSRRQRFFYRLPRHPLIAHIVLPPLVFLVLYRVPFDTPENWGKETREVYWLNGALVAAICALGLAVGFVPVLLVQLPVLMITTIIGVWLFAVQHRFEESRWMRQAQWGLAGASLEGSSFLKLPRILQWFTGNIGFHNVHHFAPHVPNYRLEACYHDVAGLQEKGPLTVRSAFAAIRLALWDEERQRLVRFRDVPSPSA
jgi:omega-6 fatty acid desaturase (delta-12 desaturase)